MNQKTMNQKTLHSFCKAGLAAALLLGALPTHAAGTAAGITITNEVALDYQVSGIAQNQETANVVFLVDRRVDVTVAADTGGLTVVPGATARILEFTVTNLSNDTQDFALSAVNGVGDDFNSVGDALLVFVENGANVGYQPAEDTATYIDELAADAAVKVYVIADIPLGLNDADAADVVLTATARQSTALDGSYTATVGSLAAGASVNTNVGSPDDPAYVDTVLGDGAGVTDAVESGDFSATDSYIVETATLAIAKYSQVISDPFNGVSVNAKAIPGAVVEYCLIVTNSGSVNASNIVLTDVIPANTAYVASSIYTAAAGTANTCTSQNGVNQDDNTGPNGDYNVTTAGAVTVTAATVASGGGVFRATFRVTINN